MSFPTEACQRHQASEGMRDVVALAHPVALSRKHLKAYSLRKPAFITQQ